jgi:hypothetical protein
MKKHFIVFLSVFVVATMVLASVSNAQTSGSVGTPRGTTTTQDAPNAFYLELLGNGVAWSINYDRFLAPDFGFRVGFGYFGIGAAPIGQNQENVISESLTSVPATLNYFIGSHDNRGRLGSSKLELGIGIVYVHVTESFFGINGAASTIGETATVGYRYQASDGGFVFRIGFTPIYVVSTLIPTGGLSLGYAF